MKTFDQLSVIGLREWINLPELGIIGLRAKIDTGASTSSLHASDIQPFQKDGEDWVRFTAYLGTQVQRRHRCEATVDVGPAAAVAGDDPGEDHLVVALQEPSLDPRLVGAGAHELRVGSAPHEQVDGADENVTFALPRELQG